MPPTAPEERRAKILQAAARVFAQQGFQAARMEDIAAEAGVAKGTLYLYFKNKDDLVLGLLEQFFTVEFSSLHALLDAPGSVRERLEQLSLHLAQETLAMQDLLAIGYEFYAVAARRPDVREVLRAYFQQWHEALATLLQQGVERGELRAVDVDAAATTLIALFEGTVLLWFTDPQSVRLTYHLQQGIALFFDGMTKQPGGTP
ncbi:hypothetical protein ARMA_0011 [Ardenticatena maritima]|uniref:HTH tetR-type domain-containing protein n=1 Tax=Ardenticatena maritima TaxID=872965 RepID=A0A0M9UB95_9CHLR|nr:TetR/AcrR family transcriptional regulator [Ardenticatena maritima]GAP61588.1 hypothetical protein ARMA_0011 [Ardenticatena maritima]